LAEYRVDVTVAVGMLAGMQSYNIVISDARAGTRGGCGAALVHYASMASIARIFFMRYKERQKSLFYKLLFMVPMPCVGAAWAFAEKRIPEVHVATVNSQRPQPPIIKREDNK
jgi:hypothetical protein